MAHDGTEQVFIRAKYIGKLMNLIILRPLGIFGNVIRKGLQRIDRQISVLNVRENLFGIALVILTECRERTMSIESNGVCMCTGDREWMG